MGSRARRCKALRARFPVSRSDRPAPIRPAFRLRRRPASPSHEGLRQRACGAQSSGNLGCADRRHRVPLLAWQFQSGCHHDVTRRFVPNCKIGPPEARGYSGGTAFAACCARATAGLSGDGEDLDAMNYLYARFEPFVEKIHLVYGKVCEDAGVLQRCCRSYWRSCPSTDELSRVSLRQPGNGPGYASLGMGSRASGLWVRLLSALLVPCSRHSGPPIRETHPGNCRSKVSC
jgi:hypothetical protein